MHLPPLIQDLAVILGTAALVSLLFRQIRLPVVLGYLLAGVLVGPNTPPVSLVRDVEGIRVWADLGVIFMMFGLGLEFSFSRLKSLGTAPAFIGPFEAVFMLAAGYGAGKAAGWSNADSVFLGAILSISSTLIIIRALEELEAKHERYAELIQGALVAEDMVGILILAALAAFGESERFSGLRLALKTGELLAIVASWIAVGSLIIPRLIDRIARVPGELGDEWIVLLSLGLCLGLVAVAAHLGYSAALGAFVMGSILAESSQARRIEGLIRPLRNVFGAVFFVSIGMLLNPVDAVAHWRAVVGVSVLTIVAKIVSTTLGARFTGQNWEDSIRVGFALAQIGEFSFIIAGLGLELGIMSKFLYPVAVSVSIVTTFATPVLMRLSRPVGRFMERASARKAA